MEIDVICYKNPPQKADKIDGVEGTLISVDTRNEFAPTGLVMLRNGDFIVKNLSLIAAVIKPLVIKK